MSRQEIAAALGITLADLDWKARYAFNVTRDLTGSRKKSDAQIWSEVHSELVREARERPTRLAMMAELNAANEAAHFEFEAADRAAGWWA